jgi:hypothetical protein
MKRSALLLAVLLGIGLETGVAQTGDAKRPAPKGATDKVQTDKAARAKSSATCSQRTCQIAVTVDSCQAIDVNPDELKLKGHNQYDITWTIPAGSRGEFRDEGIRFKAEKSAPLRALGVKKGPAVSKGGKEVRMSIAPAGGRWYYSALVAYDRKRCPDYDPVIINEM